MSMTDDDMKEIREIIRQELAAFFNAHPYIASGLPKQSSNEVDPLTAACIRSTVQADRAAAMARKQDKRRARSAK